jgi:hypothetical protein
MINTNHTNLAAFWKINDMTTHEPAVLGRCGQFGLRLQWLEDGGMKFDCTNGEMAWAASVSASSVAEMNT